MDLSLPSDFPTKIICVPVIASFII
jgi:hypothetical protein